MLQSESGLSTRVSGVELSGKNQNRMGARAATLCKRNPAHKFCYGHALVVSGGAGCTGAARLAARGALRVGAGLVTLGVPASAQLEVASQITALMLAELDGARQLEFVLNDDRINALCLGPALGLSRALALVPVALASGRPCVLDADALTAYVNAPQQLFEQVHSACVLTPHGGEFSKLFPDLASDYAGGSAGGRLYAKADAARDAAARSGCVVLLKGAETVIAAPDGRILTQEAFGEDAAPWLATAGSGDVLAGFITGLMARGLPAFEAAEMGAWLHAACARSFGPGLIAEDLPEELPKVLKDLGC